MALIKFTLNTEKILEDVRGWLEDEATRKKIAKKIDEWTETGVFDKIDLGFIQKFLKDVLKEEKPND